MKFNFTMYNAPAVAVRILVYIFVAIIVILISMINQLKDGLVREIN